LLDAGKPKLPTSFSTKIGGNPKGRSIVKVLIDDNDKITGIVNFCPASFGCSYNVPITDIQELAACIIKAFGPIPQELIDSVQVE
jgi:hypothetical protein